MENTYQGTEKYTFEQVWAALMESREQLQKDSDLLRQTREILDEKFRETDTKFKESDRKWEEAREQFKVTNVMSIDNNNQIKSTKKKINILNSNWSKLVDALVDGALIDMLNEVGIKIFRTSLREKGVFQGRQYEYDIIAKNGEDIVIVEVKTTLRVKNVKEFISSLESAKDVLPEYSSKKIYGAIAYIHVDEKAEKYAGSKGLFVIKAVGKSAKLVNQESFKPKIW